MPSCGWTVRAICLSDPGGRGVLITRPEPAAAATARLLEAKGYVPFVAPMLAVQPGLLRRPSSPPQAILITSANAVAALAACDRTTPVMAVGDATAARAAAAGFTQVISAGRDARALAALVAEECRPAGGTLLLASGAGQGLELAASLRGRGFRLQRRVAYSARPVLNLAQQTRAALAEGLIGQALFFSAASARAFVMCTIENKSELEGVEALAISHQTARALTPLPWRSIRVASHPNQDELVALLS